MKPIRVCIYGGTHLQAATVQFISALAYRILESIPAVIVTGGFLHSNAKPKAISTDSAALEGARRYSKKHRMDLMKCYEAWIPEPSLDSRPDLGDVVRMKEMDGITVRVMKGRTPLGRRLAMVADVDVVLTIAGRQHTEVVVEQALELGIPVVPIPDAGGDSRDLLVKYRDRIADGFGSGALQRCLSKISKEIDRNPDAAAKTVVKLIRTAKIKKCLVLLPYNVRHNRLYSSIIEPAVAKHMFPIRLDRLPRSDAIYGSFAEAIQSSFAVIADITVLNKNVMYEIGYAHGRGLTPLIYAQDPTRLKDLPVYFRTLNVRVATDKTQLSKLIDEYLSTFRVAHRLHQANA